MTWTAKSLSNFAKIMLNFCAMLTMIFYANFITGQNRDFLKRDKNFLKLDKDVRKYTLCSQASLTLS